MNRHERAAPARPTEQERAHTPTRIHERAAELANEIVDYATIEFADEARACLEDFRDFDAVKQLALSWLAFGLPVEGGTVSDAFLAEHGHRLSRAERAWIEAQRRAWRSVWEVTESVPGASVTAEDLLSGEIREVREHTASRPLTRGDAVLARVVDYEGASYFCGLYPRALDPQSVAELVRRARGRLRRKKAVPPEGLRDGEFGRYLIRRWEAACGGHIGPRPLEHQDPFADVEAGVTHPAPPAPSSAEEAAVIRAFKERHHADWVDQRLPALGGLTPRQAARTTDGRRQLDALLKDIERIELRQEETAFDVARLRGMLGLEWGPKAGSSGVQSSGARCPVVTGQNSI